MTRVSSPADSWSRDFLPIDAALPGDATTTARGPEETDVAGLAAAIVLPADLAVAAFARRFVRGRLGEWGLATEVDAAELLTSELVGNAVGACARAGAHVEGFLRLALTLGGGRLRIEVTDGDSRPPMPRDPGPEDEHGRGLLLVAALADRWGHHPARGADEIPAGKTVWFELDAEVPAAPLPAAVLPAPRARAASAG